MIRARWFALVALMGFGVVGTGHVSPAWSAPAKGGKATGPGKPAPNVKNALTAVPEGLRLGMSVNEVESFYDRILDRDYVPLYKKASVGVQQRALDAQLAEAKAGFRRTKVEFGNLPTGVDNTPLHHEYNYRNGEMMMKLVRGGVTRHFFFAQSRLWKIYDVLPLAPAAEGGEKGGGAVVGLNDWCEEDCGGWGSFKGVAEYWKGDLGAAGRCLPPDPAQFRFYPECDWNDGAQHIRLIDRTDEGVVGFVLEDRGASDRMAAFRAAHKEGEGAIDPSIQNVTRPGPAVDPNERAADAYTGKAHGAAPGSGPGPKKK